jgi:tetratricopeptide (TPR) repeat protein
VGGLLVGYWMAVTVFFITARYRLPLVPFVAMLSAAGISEAMARWGAGGRKRVLWALTAVLVAGAMVFPPWRPAAVGRIDPDFQMGQVYLGRGEPREAEGRLLQARDRDPGNPDVYNSLGAARYLAGDLPGAEDYYLRALRFGRFSEVYFNLGVVYERMGETRHREAVTSYRRALARNPLERRARVNMEGLTGRRLP